MWKFSRLFSTLNGCTFDSFRWILQINEVNLDFCEAYSCEFCSVDPKNCLRFTSVGHKKHRCKDSFWNCEKESYAIFSDPFLRKHLISIFVAVAYSVRRVSCYSALKLPHCRRSFDLPPFIIICVLTHINSLLLLLFILPYFYETMIWGILLGLSRASGIIPIVGYIA